MARVCEVLSQCNRTSIRSDLLRNLLNGDPSDYFPGHRASSFLYNGHSRGAPERQVLCYIIRRALNIVRMPGTYDVQIKRRCFENIDHDELEDAIREARRLYDFTQNEMRRVWQKTDIPLVRGLRGVEASAAHYLLSELDGDQVPFYLSTLTFFNFKSGAFNGEIHITMPCPIEWIWVSQYTVADLDVRCGGSCEEFIVTCLDPSGMIELERTNLTYTPSPRPLEPLVVTGQHHHESGEERRRHIGHAIAELTHDGIEPHDDLSYGLEFSPGKWERRLGKFARTLIRFGRQRDNRSQYSPPRVHRRIKLH